MMHTFRCRCAVLGALFGVLIPRVGAAQAPPSSPPSHAHAVLDYTAPSDLSCPDREAFASAIATRLGYEAVTTEAAPDAKTLTVRYRREKAALHVTLRLASAQAATAERDLVSETGACAELGAAAAFAAAILLDPRAMFPRPKQAPPPRGAPAVSLDSNAPGTWPWYEPRSPIPEPPPPSPSPSEPWKWRGGLAATSCAGCAPALNVGAALFLGVAKGRLGLDAGARADLPASTSSPGKTASASLVLGELFPHARLGPARLGVVGVAGSLFGARENDKQTSLFAALGARAALEFRLIAPVFLRVALDGSAVLNRVSLRLQGVELWSTPSFIAGGSIGAGAEF